MFNNETNMSQRPINKAYSYTAGLMGYVKGLTSIIFHADEFFEDTRITLYNEDGTAPVNDVDVTLTVQ